MVNLRPSYMSCRPLRSECELYLKFKLVDNSDLFRDAPKEFLRDLVLEMKMVCFLSGDYIVREGEVGTSMFFISRGSCMVTIHKKQITLLQPGKAFGDIAVLQKCKRTASVHAWTNVTLYELDKMALDKLRSRFPGLIEDQITRHMHSSNLIFSPVSWQRTMSSESFSDAPHENTVIGQVQDAVQPMMDIVQNLVQEVKELRSRVELQNAAKASATNAAPAIEEKKHLRQER